ncbi:ECF RNA polymerase sigma factor SigK [Nocardioides insulae]|uniref:ECF RNA polymerase sigma factor SigK n=1 Tax=Nocardioides insulae TaxID=394734 RepID=UPI0003FA3FDB|nr:ECF RNA polymerase sigma factor SigK [Nocardioides insulae]
MDPGNPEPAERPLAGTPAGADLAGLLRRSARGDRAAFAEVYDATVSRVYGQVVRVMRDAAQAEEVTQEIYLEIWRRASRFDPARGSALGWVLAIAHSRAVDRVRSSEAATRRETTYQVRNRSIDHDTTADAAHSSLEARRVRTALAQLTEVQREAVELAYFGGYTHTEVATLLDLPVGTAKSRIRDGLIRLRDTIGGAR